MEKEYLEKLQNLEVEFSERIKALREDVRANKTTAFEVGKWYTITDGNGVCLFNHQNSGNSYGFTEDGWLKGNWYTGAEYFLNDAPRVRPATDKEIEEALIKEAEKRGFKAGVKTEYGNICSDTKHSYHSEADSFYYHNIRVYRKGVWCEIVKEKEVTIAGLIVSYKDGGVLIDDKCYSKGQIQALRDILMAGQVKYLVAGCNNQHKIYEKDIQNILSRWK